MGNCNGVALLMEVIFVRKIVRFTDEFGQGAINRFNDWLKEHPQYELVSINPTPIYGTGGLKVYCIVEIPTEKDNTAEQSSE